MATASPKKPLSSRNLGLLGCDSKPDVKFHSPAATSSRVQYLGYSLYSVFFRFFLVYHSPEQFSFGLGGFFFWKSAL